MDKVTKRPSTERPDKVKQADNNTKKPTKLEVILSALADGKKLHRFNAFQYGDTCLHTTVSTLQNSYAVIVSRKFIKYTTINGHDARVRLYWLEPEQVTKAEQLLKLMRKRRQSC